MIALGNDIVDLKEIPKNGSAYFNRLFSYAVNASEREFWSRFNLPNDQLIRILWAIKEAAYKSSMKLGNVERFNPKLFTVSSLEVGNNLMSGSVIWNDNMIPFKGSLSPDYVHVTTSGISDDVKHFVSKRNESENQSDAVRSLILNKVGNGYSIVKDQDSIPWLKNRKGDLTELSLSHDGRFIACAFTI